MVGKGFKDIYGNCPKTEKVDDTPIRLYVRVSAQRETQCVKWKPQSDTSHRPVLGEIMNAFYSFVLHSQLCYKNVTFISTKVIKTYICMLLFI